MAIIVGLFIAIFISIRCYNSQLDVNYYNKARVILTEDIAAINEGRYNDVKHDFYIIDTKGRVVWSNINDIKKEMLLDISEQIQNDHAFYKNNTDKVKLVFSLNGDNETVGMNAITGFAICIIDKSLVQSENKVIRVIRVMLPTFIWGLIVIIYMLCVGCFIHKKILWPINELTESSISIIEGNYEEDDGSKRDALNGTAVGGLAYQFSLMKDELRTKREREEQLKKSQKELMSCMSHDLRTPITTIKAHAEAIRDGLAVTQDKKDKYINTIIYKTDVVSKMISDLLDHSNAELNQLAVNRQEIYIHEYMNRLIRELEIYCRHSECIFESDIQVPEMIVVMDSNRITQVIFNLVENAVKYMDKDEKHVWMKVYIRNERLYVSIKDNGPGISLTDIPYVFDRFYRAEKSRSTQIPGAGLGLSICKYIVEVHEGEITLESHTGEGSEFTFYIAIGR